MSGFVEGKDSLTLLCGESNNMISVITVNTDTSHWLSTKQIYLWPVWKPGINIYHNPNYYLCLPCLLPHFWYFWFFSPEARKRCTFNDLSLLSGALTAMVLDRVRTKRIVILLAIALVTFWLVINIEFFNTKVSSQGNTEVFSHENTENTRGE